MVVEAAVLVRAGFDMASKPVGQLKKGDEVKCLESKVNDKGATRIKFKGAENSANPSTSRLEGWVSLAAGDGTVLLEPAAGSAQSKPEAKAKAKAPPTRTKPAAKGALRKYKVVEPAGVLVRAGFDMKSKPVGQLKKGEELECLESKVNDRGTTRIRFKGRLEGWASLTTGSGDTLLEAIADSEKEGDAEDTDSPAPAPAPRRVAPPARANPASRSRQNSGTDSDSSDSSDTDSEHSGWTDEKDEPKKAVGKKADASGTSEPATGSSNGMPSFQATCPVLVRTGFEMNSKPAGQLLKGEQVEAIEIKKNSSGIDRVHFKGRLSGWASLTTKDGATLLERLGESEPAPASAKAKITAPPIPKSGGPQKKTAPPIPKKSGAPPIPKTKAVAPPAAKNDDDRDDTDSDEDEDDDDDEEDEDEEEEEKKKPAPRAMTKEQSNKKGGGRAPSAAALRLEEGAPAASEAEDEQDSAVTDWLNSEPVRLGQYATAFAEAGLIMEDDLIDMDDEDIEDIAESSGMKKAETKRFARELAKLKNPPAADEDEQKQKQEKEDEEEEEQPTKRSNKQPNAKQLRPAYRVVEKGGVVVRAGFDMKSDYRGNLGHDTQIEALDSRKNDKGIMRIKFWWKDANAWVSTHAGDGTMLLEQVEALSESESESGGSESDTPAESVESDTVDDLFSSAIQNNLVIALDNKIVAACRTGKIDLAMDVLQLVVGQGESPGSEALSALIVAQAKVSIKKAFKLLQYGLEVPPASMPSADAVVAFVQHCEAASIEMQAVERVESILTSMHERGFTVTKQVKVAVRSLRQSAAATLAKAEEAAEAAKAQKAQQRAQAEEQALAISRTESFPQDDSTDSEFDSENEWSASDENEDGWLKEAAKSNTAADRSASQAVAPAPTVIGEKVQQLFRVVAPGGAVMREGLAVGSKDAETLSCGALVEAVEIREDDSGTEAVRCAQGWASTKTPDGLSLLAPVDSAESPWSIASDEPLLPVDEPQQTDEPSDQDSQSDSLDSLHLDDDSDADETVTTESTRSRSSAATSSSRSTGSRSSRSSSSRGSSRSTSTALTTADQEESSDEDWELNESGFRSIKCIGGERMVDENRQPYAVYRFAVQDVAHDGVSKGKAWRIARRFASFLELREAMKSPDVLPDETARNTISQLPFPSKSHSFADKLDPRLLDQRAAGLHRFMQGVLRWAARGAVLSFLHDDGSDNAVLDMATSQHFMAGSESAGMRWSRPLVMGNRSPAEKNSYFIRGVGRSAQDMVLSVLTPPGSTVTDPGTGKVSFADAPSTVQVMSKSARGHFRSCVCDMDHRYVQPPSELAYIKRSKDTSPTRKSRKKERQLNGDQGYKLLVFRPMCALGSLRDMIFRSASPLDHHSLKYRGIGT